MEIIDLRELLIALLAGGLINAERKFRDRAAGFCTLILICAGAALFTMLSPRSTTAGDPARETCSFEIILPRTPEKVEELAAEFHKAGLTIISRKVVKGKDHLLVHIEAYAADKNFIQLTSRLIQDPAVHEFRS